LSFKYFSNFSLLINEVEILCFLILGSSGTRVSEFEQKSEFELMWKGLKWVLGVGEFV
jgi:hypothetical protein